MSYPQASHGDFGWRLATSLLLGGLAGVLVWRPPLGRTIQLSPARLIALIGACWWLWLAPGVVGFAILVATLVLTLAGRLRSAIGQSGDFADRLKSGRSPRRHRPRPA